MDSRIKEVTYYKHTGVKPDGTFEGKGGAVRTDSDISMSHPKGGCGLKGCGCSKGHWICIGKGRTDDGVVEGKTVKFKSRKDMKSFLDDADALSKLRTDW